jgi:serine phosphatase RsbU (regulator of sigma subunit)
VERWSDRERVLALLWAVGGVLTVLTLVLPHAPYAAEGVRWLVAGGCFVACGLLLLAPPLPDAALHALVAFGTCVIALCTSLGVPDVEGVMFVLPVLFAFGAFPRRGAVPHLVLAALAYAIVLTVRDSRDLVAPEVAWTLVMGVAGVAGVAVAALAEARERERSAGARDRRIAEVLQRTLLPERLPQTDAVGLTARYLPATDEASVGGDLYDAMELGDGRVAVAIGDVEGKGLRAAAMVGQVRASLRALALDDPDPGRVLCRLNRVLADQPGELLMTTLVYLVIDPAERTVTWSCAGHPRPLLLPAGGAPAFLAGGHGPPLGADPSHRFTAAHTTAGPGDRLLLYTDGAVERRGESLQAGLDRLRDAAAEAGEGSAALLDAALGVLPGARRDDVAVVAVTLFDPARAHATFGQDAPVLRERA